MFVNWLTNQAFAKKFDFETVDTTDNGYGLLPVQIFVFGTTPEETAVFADVLHAIKAANSAGFVTYAVEDGSSRQD